MKKMEELRKIRQEYAELIYQYHFEKIHELDKAVSGFAYNWYNQIRPYSHNGYVMPYEKRFSFNG